MQNQTYSSSNYILTNNLDKSIRELFDSYNIIIHSDGVNELNIFCPFHKNIHSPAFYINTKTGLWQCFNPSCGKKGNFRQLYKAITGTPFGKDVKLDPVALSNELEKSLKYSENKDKLEIDISDVEIDYSLDDDIHLLDTMISRGLSIDTLEYFEVGYSKVKERVVIPVRDQKYKLVGFIGRAINDSQDPRYLYNKGFKRAEVLFNLQNAKHFDECIIVEGSIDCMFVHQSGFPNVVATLGSRISENQFSMIRKYFDSITIFSDNDEAGIQMMNDILDSCRGKELYIANIPSGKKDPGEMTENEIQQSINNKQIQF